MSSAVQQIGGILSIGIVRFVGAAAEIGRAAFVGVERKADYSQSITAVPDGDVADRRTRVVQYISGALSSGRAISNKTLISSSQ